MSLLATSPRPSHLVTRRSSLQHLHETLDAYVSNPGAARTKPFAGSNANGVFQDNLASQRCIGIRYVRERERQVRESTIRMGTTIARRRKPPPKLRHCR